MYNSYYVIEANQIKSYRFNIYYIKSMWYYITYNGWYAIKTNQRKLFIIEKYFFHSIGELRR